MTGNRHRTPRALALAGLFLPAALLALPVLCGCGLNDVKVTVANESRLPLDSLRVVGESHAKRVRSVAPGGSATVRFEVNGEDALALRGRIGGRSLVPQMSAYVEAGYSLRFAVDSGGVVHPEVRAPY